MKQFITTHKTLVCIIAVLCVAVIGSVVAFAVGADKEKQEETTTVSETTIEETTTQKETTETTTVKETADPYLKGGKMYSRLTGMPVSKKIGTKRPIAIMINNIGDAIPQSGISSADVIYEATVEGGITRMMAMFENYDKISRIGSVRSCRFYFPYWAVEWDAIYAHFGQSGFAMDFLKSGKVDALNAMDNSAFVTFYRDPSKVAPHNVFATPAGIRQTINDKQYRTTYKKNVKKHFQFAKYGTEYILKTGFKASRIDTNYPVNHSYFVYNKKTKLYERFQFGTAHIDELNQKQLTCSNVIIQQADAPLFGDGKSVDFQIVGSGKGMYFTRGKGIKIIWKKSKDTSITHFYDEKGKEIKLNTGKTFICVMPSDQTPTITK